MIPGRTDIENPQAKVRRTESETKSATYLAVGASQIGETTVSRPSLRDRLRWLHHHALETRIASMDFPAHRNRFPVPNYRESVTMVSETLGNLGPIRA